MNTLEKQSVRFNKSVSRTLNFVINNWLFLSAIATASFTFFCYIRVIEYFRYYKINFLEYGSVSDLIILGLRFDADVNLAAIIFVMLFIIFVFSYCIEDWANINTLGDQLSAPSKIKSGNTKIIYGGLFLLLLCFTFMVATFMPKASESIPLESRKRVEVSFERAPPVKCLTIIATTADWMFFWQHEKREPLVISKPKVLKIETMVSRQPLIERIRDKTSSNAPIIPDILIDSREEVAAHNKWVKELNEKCGDPLSDLRRYREHSNDVPQPIKE